MGEMTSKQIEQITKRMDRELSVAFPKGIEGTGRSNTRATLEVAWQLAKLNEWLREDGIRIYN
jgi:hypothetical protein